MGECFDAHRLATYELHNFVTCYSRLDHRLVCDLVVGDDPPRSAPSFGVETLINPFEVRTTFELEMILTEVDNCMLKFLSKIHEFR